MQFIDFQTRFSIYPVFSLQDIRKLLPEFSYRQLDRWEKHGYLKKIKRGFYCFSGQLMSREALFYVANKIYSPSYISLEMALKYYGLIPEEIFQITSIGTKKAVHFETPIGNFNYRQIKPTLFWGYRLVDFEGKNMLIAELEKAILDYLYIHANLKTVDDFVGMRLNVDEFKTQINVEKFHKYLEAFGSKALSRRVRIFLKTLENDKS